MAAATLTFEIVRVVFREAGRSAVVIRVQGHRRLRLVESEPEGA